MKRTLSFIFAIAVSAAAIAQTPLPNDPEVKVGKLDNGLTYYIRHNDKPAQRADFYLVSNVGAIQEGPGQDGLAHFLEHMCFNGLKNLPGKQMLEYLQSIGASFGGNINASTGVEVTQYMLNNIPVVREGIVDTCLLVMHDYSHFVLNDPAEIEAERGVILEEKRTRNTASWRLFEKSAPYIYGDTKYATTNIIGSEETLKTFQQPTLVDFYQTWYRPDNQAVIVVGDLDVNVIESKIKDLFADIPAPENPRPKDVITIPDNDEPIIGVLTDPELQSNNIEILWKRPAIPEQFNNTDVAFVTGLLESVMSTVMDERFSDITSKPGAAFMSADIGNGNLTRTCAATFGSVDYKNGQDMEALNALLTEIERLKRYGITEAEFQRAKDNILSAYEKAAQGAESRKNPEFIRPLINAFTTNSSYLAPQTRYELANMVFGQINSAVVNQLASAYITDNNMVVLLEGSSLEEHPTAEQIKEAIYASRSAEVAAPAVEESNLVLMDASKLKGSKVKKSASTIANATEWTLKNGIRVVVLPTEYKKDEVQIKLEMNGGESLMTDEELFSFDNNIWSLYRRNAGLAEFTSTEINKMLAGKMASASPFIGATSHGISAHSTPKDLETAFQLLYLNVVKPRFEADEYQIGLDQLAAMLPNLETDPMFQLQKRLPSALYGDTPRRFTISQDVIAKASIKNVEAAYKRLFQTTAGATVYVVGNVDMDTLKPLVEKYIGSLPAKGKALNWKDEGIRFCKGEKLDHFTTKMETPKVTVLQLFNADLPASVENELLLDASTYILNMIYTDTLREEEGGTYGASAAGMFQKRPVESALIQVFFDTNVEQAASLEALALKGIRELAANGPSDEYFNRTVENFKNTLPQKRITNNYWMSVLSDYYEFGYNKDTEYEAAVNVLTKEKIAAFLSAFLAQGNFTEMEMGPAIR